MDVLGDNLRRFLSGVFILLDNLLKEFMKESNGLVILVQGLRHHQHFPIAAVPFVYDQFQLQVLYLRLFVFILESK